jgi:small subunit ribosomal protein S4
MGRYLGPKCRLCRREGVKLFLKGPRCLSNQCPIEKKQALPPGQHGVRGRRRLSDYGSQLREKQKLKRLYGVTERQLERYFGQALKKREDTGEVLLQLLETRLDNIVYRLGFVPSRSMARQLISHGHVSVNGKKVNIPSLRVSPGATLSVSSGALSLAFVKKSLSEHTKLPDWLEKKAAVGRLVRVPERAEVEADIDENSIVEFYSR